MALSRRTGQRFQNSIWPGFVDAMTGLLLVLMFVLTIFMVVQFVLRETITGQEAQLDNLSVEIAALAEALGLEQKKSADLTARVGELDATLAEARDTAAAQEALIASLTAERDAQTAALNAARTQISDFEARVAALLVAQDRNLATIADLEQQRDDNQASIAALEGEKARLIDEAEALNLALAQARSEIDAQTEAARLAAAKREAMEALIADLQADNADAADRNAALLSQLERLEGDNASLITNKANLEKALAELEQALSDEEKARLAEAAAAEALRERLKNADAELTAMTLALEAKRREAEETLTLLAAAEAASKDLTQKLAAALLAQDNVAAELERARRDLDAARGGAEATASRLSDLENQLAAALAEIDQGTLEIAELRTRLSEAEASLASSEGRAEELEARLAAERASLEERLAEALAAKLKVESDIEDAEAALAQALAAKLAAEQEVTAALKAQEAAEAQAREARDAMSLTEAELQNVLAKALADKLAAEQQAREAMSEVERQEVLLNAAKNTLSEQQELASEAQKQQELLNQQLAALRTQLSSLQAIIDDYKSRDAASKVQIETLGSDLNAALARAAAEERKRRQLEEAERLRLEEEKRRLEAEKQDLEKYRSDFFGRLRDVLGNQDGVRIVGDRFVFSSEVLFASGSADLSGLGTEEIAKVARILRGVIGEIPPEIDWIIRVDGHTDDQPIGFGAEFADNWELSQARALSVVRFMVERLGIPPNRVSANGFGEFQPVNPADTAEARAQNRRIELKFTER